MAMEIFSLSNAVTLPLRRMTRNLPGAVAAMLVESVGVVLRPGLVRDESIFLFLFGIFVCIALPSNGQDVIVKLRRLARRVSRDTIGCGRVLSQAQYIVYILVGKRWRKTGKAVDKIGIFIDFNGLLNR
jgi:hypothetical protein